MRLRPLRQHPDLRSGVPDPHLYPANAEGTIGETAECPVMAGTPVIKAEAEAKGLYRDYEGQRYWLCCPGCGPKFDANPAQYAHAG
nr:YHS domain-containing protein [Corynebacterium auriscanis]